MSRVWIYRNNAQFEEEFNDGERSVDPRINLDTLRFYSEDGHPLPLEIITPNDRSSRNPHPEVVVTKDDITYTGFLNSITDKTASIINTETSNKVIIRDYDTIVYNEISQLYPIITSSQPGVLRYQKSSLNWTCQADVFLDQNNNLSNISFCAVIHNQQQHDIQDFTQISLVSGKIPMREEMPFPEGNIAARSMAAFSASSEHDANPTFTDYMIFPLQITQLNPGTTYLPFLTFALEESQRVYIYDLDNDKGLVRVGYIFDTPQDFPSSNVHVYDASGMYLGFSNLLEKRRGESVRMYLGETTSIIAKTYLTNENIHDKGNSFSTDNHVQQVQSKKGNIFWTNTRVNFTSQIKNTKESGDEEIVIARYYVGRSKISQITCQGGITDDGYLEFIVNLRPGEEKTLTCTFVLEA